MPDSPGGTSIGTRLRNRRRVLRLTLAEVANSANLSEGFLSQLERDRTSASIATLQRVCAAVDMPVGDLFAERDPVRVHRWRDASFNPYGPGGRKVRITPSDNAQLESFIGEFEPGGSTGAEPYAHGHSEEMILVVEGRIEATIGDDTHVLERLDSVTYSSHVPHRVREIAGERAVVLWAMSPPSF